MNQTIEFCARWAIVLLGIAAAIFLLGICFWIAAVVIEEATRRLLRAVGVGLMIKQWRVTKGAFYAWCRHVLSRPDPSPDFCGGTIDRSSIIAALQAYDPLDLMRWREAAEAGNAALQHISDTELVAGRAGVGYRLKAGSLVTEGTVTGDCAGENVVLDTGTISDAAIWSEGTAVHAQSVNPRTFPPT